MIVFIFLSFVILEGSSLPSAWIHSISHHSYAHLPTSWAEGFAFCFAFSAKGCLDLPKWPQGWYLSFPRHTWDIKPFVSAIKLDFLYCENFDQVSNFARGTKTETKTEFGSDFSKSNFDFCTSKRPKIKMRFCLYSKTKSEPNYVFVSVFVTLVKSKT